MLQVRKQKYNRFIVKGHKYFIRKPTCQNKKDPSTCSSLPPEWILPFSVCSIFTVSTCSCSNIKYETLQHYCIEQYNYTKYCVHEKQNIKLLQHLIGQSKTCLCVIHFTCDICPRKTYKSTECNNHKDVTCPHLSWADRHCCVWTSHQE